MHYRLLSVVSGPGSTSFLVGASDAQAKRRASEAQPSGGSSSGDAQNSSNEEASKTEDDDLSTSTPQRIKGVEPVSIEELRVSDFILVTVGDNKHTKAFIAPVIDTWNRTEVIFMKQSGKMTYVFPCAPDEAFVEERDIIGRVTDIVPDRRGSQWNVPFNTVLKK